MTTTDAAPARISGPHRQRGRAAWTLALLTTLCAELTFTAVAVPWAWLLLPLLMIMYGAGVLLVREAAVRVGGGWVGLVLLAVAYQLTEDGLGLQALTSPDMYDAADWGLRAHGVNWTYWEGQIGVHVVLSVLIPVALTDLLFPHLKGRSYLGPRGLAGTAALAVVGVLGLRFLISATEDPGYQTPWPFALGTVGLIALLVLLALRVVPRLGLARLRQPGRPPPPVVVGLLAGYLTMAFLTTLLPLGLDDTLLMGDLMSHRFRLVAAALTGLAAGWLVLRWSARAGWDDRRRVWLVGGVLVSHTAFMMPASVLSLVLGSVTLVAQVVLLVLLARHLRRRASSSGAAEVATPAHVAQPGRSVQRG